MDRFANYENVAAADSTFVGAEGKAISFNNALTPTGAKVKGIIVKGMDAGLPSYIQSSGETTAIVNGATTAIAVGDGLVGGAAAGILVKGTSDRCVALEAATTDGATIAVRLM